MFLNLSKITGFSCNNKKIYVTDEKGERGLYFFDNPKGKNITFNLIAGRWRTNNELKELKKPLIYVCPPLPYKTVNREVKEFRFRVGSNPNKCTIDFRKPYADVFIDHEINEQDIPHFVFVMFHENGHFRYGGIKKNKDLEFDSKEDEEKYFLNEFYCDSYASKKMLERGFNPSQCLFAIEMCLSEEENARWRKDKIFEWLKKVKVK